MTFDLKWAAIATLLSGSGYYGLAPNGESLSPHNLVLLKSAVAHVLESHTVGTAAGWQGEDGLAGRATLVRVFEQGGHPCGDVEHTPNWAATAPYFFTLCKVDGEWKFSP